MRAAWLAVLLLPYIAWAQAAAPENPNVEARRVAERLGQERNVEGLRVILESRNVDLVKAYDSGMRHGPVAPKMPPAIEALLVQYYDDPVVGGALRVLASWDRPQGRALFDKMLAEWKSGTVRPSTYPMRDSALHTDAPGAEAALTEWIASPQAPKGEDLRRVVSFIGSKGYTPAVPVLARLDLGLPQLDDASAIVNALLDMKSAAATEAALARMAELKRLHSARGDEVRNYALQRIAADPGKTGLGYRRFAALEPEAAKANAAAWLSKAKDRDALDDTIALLSATPPRYDAIPVLVATDDPAVWRRARDEVERLHRQGTWDDGHYRFAASELDRKLADPAAHFAQRDIERRYQAYQQGLAPILKARGDATALKASDPAAWLETMRRLAVRQEALARENGIDAKSRYGGVGGDIAQQYFHLGDFARFRLKRPRDAVSLYESAEQWGFAFAALAAGDTTEWDLGDRPAALALYRRIATDLRAKASEADDRSDAMFNAALLHWVDAQAAWLAERRPFRGAIDETDVGTAALVAMFGAMAGEAGPAVPALPPSSGEALARDLAAMPPSGAAFIATALATQYLPSARAIRAHVARMDPAGYSTAAFFVLVQHLDPVRQPEGMRVFPALAGDRSPSHPLRVAAREFLRERGVVDRVPARPLR